MGKYDLTDEEKRDCLVTMKMNDLLSDAYKRKIVIKKKWEQLVNEMEMEFRVADLLFLLYSYDLDISIVKYKINN